MLENEKKRERIEKYMRKQRMKCEHLGLGSHMRSSARRSSNDAALEKNVY